MEEDQYFQAIVAAGQALEAKDPAEAERLLATCPPGMRNWEWRHLERRLHPELLTIQGHSGFACPDFRPDTMSAECRADALSGPIWEAGGARDSAGCTAPMEPPTARPWTGPEFAWPRPDPTAR